MHKSKWFSLSCGLLAPGIQAACEADAVNVSDGCRRAGPLRRRMQGSHAGCWGPERNGGFLAVASRRAPPAPARKEKLAGSFV